MCDDQLLEILSNLGYKFEVVKFDGTVDSFDTEIRSSMFCQQEETPTSISWSDLCQEWITKFSKVSKTNWIVKQSFPNPQRFQFRKLYVCQHSEQNKTSDSQYKNMPRSRDKGCEASIDIKIKNDTLDTRKKDKFVKLGMLAIIKISFVHTHLINVAQAQSFLRMTKEVEQQFIGYFDNGLTSSGAKNLHEIGLIASAEDTEIGKLLANAHVNPTSRQISHLYENWRKSNYGDRTIRSVVEMLKGKVEDFSRSGVELFIQEDPFVVVVVTPTMRRAHNEEFSGEIVFVDSSGFCDQTNTCVTFMFSASKIGALPLACILHLSQTKENYYTAFQCAQEFIGSTGFGGSGSPSVIMTDDSEAERAALKRVFPSSSLLLCTFHVCQAIWRWLWNASHKIAKEERKLLMGLFRKIIFASDQSICDKEFENLINNKISKRYPNYIIYIEKLWTRREEWAHHYRKCQPTRGHHTNNYVESSIRIFKDIVLQRCKSFNACSLVDFIACVFEQYHKRKLLKFASCRVTRQEHLYLKLKAKSALLKVSPVNEWEYIVSSGSNSNVNYNVDIESEICDCVEGNGGCFCKHLCAVNTHLDGELLNSPSLSAEDRLLFAKIAEGNSVDVNFYKDMMNINSIAEKELSEGEMSSEEIQNSIQAVSDVMDTHGEDSGIPESFKIEVQRLRENYNKMCQIAVENYSQSMYNVVKKLNTKLENISSSSQLLSYYCPSAGKFSRRRIPVQPTAQSRRKRRPGLKYGAAVIQAGRPSNIELGRISKMKKKRNLGINIKLNKPNAKSH